MHSNLKNNVCTFLFNENGRFSSGDLSSECDDADPNDPTASVAGASGTASAARPVLQQQPLPQSSSGGPPNIPPPPAPNTNVPPGDLSLNFGKTPLRGTSAPTSPAKSRESLLQRVQSLTGAARDQGASIIGAYFECLYEIFTRNCKQLWVTIEYDFGRTRCCRFQCNSPSIQQGPVFQLVGSR